MDKETAIKLFEDKRIRVLWNEEQEKWFFSITDVAGILSESDNPRKYWSVLKTRLKAEGSQLATNCSQLTNLELVLNMLAEASTTEISKEMQPETFEENKTVACKWNGS